MNAEKVNIYEACDRAIRGMNRWNLEAFGKLKTAKFDEVNVIRMVLDLYEKSVKQAKKRYLEVAYEGYVLYLLLMDVEPKRANRMAEETITREWVDGILKQTDPLTLYRFTSETERKAYRLAEALPEALDKGHEIDKALRLWTAQLAQFAINFTDYAGQQAMKDLEVRKVIWDTAHDEKVCQECGELDGQVFLLSEVPAKPHHKCRCRILPYFGKDE